MIRKSEITAFVQRLVQEFDPERVILFGSCARGKPTADSDVDLLVVMNYRGDWVDKAVEMRLRIPQGRPCSGKVISMPGSVPRTIPPLPDFVGSR